MASSFRMMLFPPREAMTTAELPEPCILQHIEFIICKQILLKIGGPAARHSVYSVCSVDSSLVFIRVNSWFQFNVLVAA